MALKLMAAFGRCPAPPVLHGRPRDALDFRQRERRIDMYDACSVGLPEDGGHPGVKFSTRLLDPVEGLTAAPDTIESQVGREIQHQGQVRFETAGGGTIGHPEEAEIEAPPATLVCLGR